MLTKVLLTETPDLNMANSDRICDVTGNREVLTLDLCFGEFGLSMRDYSYVYWEILCVIYFSFAHFKFSVERYIQ